MMFPCLGPSAFGTLPPAAQNHLPNKAPGAFLKYQVSLTALFPSPYPNIGDPIVGLSLAINPSGDGEMVIAFFSLIDGETASWWAWAGVPGRYYQLDLIAQTASGLVYEWILDQVCDPATAQYPLPLAPVPGFGDPVIWSQGAVMFAPLQNLPAVTSAATGSTQVGATPIPLALVLVNASSGGSSPGVILPKSTTFGNQIMWITNVTGGTITVYPYAGDTFAGLAVNQGTVVQDQQTIHVYVGESGFLVVS